MTPAQLDLLTNMVVVLQLLVLLAEMVLIGMSAEEVLIGMSVDEDVQDTR